MLTTNSLTITDFITEEQFDLNSYLSQLVHKEEIAAE